MIRFGEKTLQLSCFQLKILSCLFVISPLAHLLHDVFVVLIMFTLLIIFDKWADIMIFPSVNFIIQFTNRPNKTKHRRRWWNEPTNNSGILLNYKTILLFNDKESIKSFVKCCFSVFFQTLYIRQLKTYQFGNPFILIMEFSNLFPPLYN